MKTVLILAHAHAEILAGGGERAALSMFEWMERESDVSPILLARAEEALVGHSAQFGAFRGNLKQIVANLPHHDQFSLESTNFKLLERMIDDLVDRFRPDLVHIEHFAFWSLDVIALFERRGVPVVMTLHEFLLICNNDGQMVKTWGPLCHAESPSECSLCFPKRTAGEFYLRKTIIQERLKGVAKFVSPSRFLARRFEAWGIASDRIAVIDNPLAPDLIDAAAVQPSEREPHADDRIVIGYFGQINRYKGVLPLLEAVKLLPPDLAKRVTLVIHGANLDMQPEEFRERFAALLADTADVVRLSGPYANGDVVRLMRSCDWVVVPSVWWENSPIVIQEALVAGRPVLCSDIGGMAEKIADGVPGATFRPNDPDDLAQKLGDIAAGRLAVARGAAGVVDANAARVAAYLEVYGQVMAAE